MLTKKAMELIMNEIEITSGRMNPQIDPHLNIWGWEIPWGGFAVSRQVW